MITTKVISQSKPEEMLYNLRSDKTAEVWLRKNIRQTTTPTSAPSEEGGGDDLVWMYDEVYFRTSESKETVEADFEGFYSSGASWEVGVPLSQSERIAQLEQQLKDAEAKLAESNANNDMAIAELTMVMAAMMGGV